MHGISFFFFLNTPNQTVLHAQKHKIENHSLQCIWEVWVVAQVSWRRASMHRRWTKCRSPSLRGVLICGHQGREGWLLQEKRSKRGRGMEGAPEDSIHQTSWPATGHYGNSPMRGAAAPNISFLIYIILAVSRFKKKLKLKKKGKKYFGERF